MSLQQDYHTIPDPHKCHKNLVHWVLCSPILSSRACAVHLALSATNKFWKCLPCVCQVAKKQSEGSAGQQQPLSSKAQQLTKGLGKFVSQIINMYKSGFNSRRMLLQQSLAKVGAQLLFTHKSNEEEMHRKASRTAYK